jgi:hypothetical protein
VFTNLQILNDESETHFLKHFTIVKAKAIISHNSNTKNEIVGLFLAAINPTTNVHYLYVNPHYLLEHR